MGTIFQKHAKLILNEIRQICINNLFFNLHHFKYECKKAFELVPSTRNKNNNWKKIGIILSYHKNTIDYIIIIEIILQNLFEFVFILSM